MSNTASLQDREQQVRLEDLLTLAVSIASPSGYEAELVSALSEKLDELGFTTRVDEAGNIIGEIGPESGPEIMLLGHVDTVPGVVPVRREGHLLYGRGSVDAKGPFVAMVLAASQAARVRAFPCRVTVIGVVEEETPQSRGAVHILNSRPAPAALIVGEPSGWSEVVLGYKGKLDLRFSASCASTHPSKPEPKAADLMVQAWAVLTDELGEHSHDSFNLPGVTLLSCTADMTDAVMEIDLRTPVGFDVDEYVARVRKRLGDGGSFDVIHSVDAVRASRSNPVVRALHNAIHSHGSRPRHKVKTGTSDMNTLAARWRVPMATYGPGDSALDHASDEHVDVREVGRSVLILTQTLIELAAALSPSVLQQQLEITSQAMA